MADDTHDFAIVAESNSITIACPTPGCQMIETFDENAWVSIRDLLAAIGEHQHHFAGSAEGDREGQER